MSSAKINRTASALDAPLEQRSDETEDPGATAPSGLRGAAKQPGLSLDAQESLLAAQRAFPLGAEVSIKSGEIHRAFKDGVVAGHGYLEGPGVGSVVPSVLVRLTVEDSFWSPGKEMWVSVTPVHPDMLVVKG